MKKVGYMKPKNELEIISKEPWSAWVCIKYSLALVRHKVSHWCSKIAKQCLFETLILLLIIINCVILTMDDPTSDYQPDWIIIINEFFQAVYTFEMLIKIFAMGFLFNQGAYLRDFWNILDFIIVVFGFAEYFNIGKTGFDMKVLRIFRVLRPLRTVTSVEGLRILLTALFSSFHLILDAVIIELFFLSICAIAGLQLWNGSLTKRCKNVITGNFDTTRVCGAIECPHGFVCEEYGQNPNFGYTNFDDFFSALLTVFTCVTQEGWSDVQQNLINAYGYPSIIFFTIVIIVGSYFVFNFTLAVIKTKVSKIYKKSRKAKRIAALTLKSSKMNIAGAEGNKFLALQFSKNGQNLPPKSIFSIISQTKKEKKVGSIIKEEEKLPLIKYKEDMGFMELEEDVIELMHGYRWKSQSSDHILIRQKSYNNKQTHLINHVLPMKPKYEGRYSKLPPILEKNESPKNSSNLADIKFRALIQENQDSISESLEIMPKKLNRSVEYVARKTSDISIEENEEKISVLLKSPKMTNLGRKSLFAKPLKKPLFKRSKTTKCFKTSMRRFSFRENSIKLLSKEINEQSSNPYENDKFVFNRKEEITMSSLTDVIPHKISTVPKAYKFWIEPYKIQVKYKPTIMPPEEKDESYLFKKPSKTQKPTHSKKEVKKSTPDSTPFRNLTPGKLENRCFDTFGKAVDTQRKLLQKDRKSSSRIIDSIQNGSREFSDRVNSKESTKHERIFKQNSTDLNSGMRRNSKIMIMPRLESFDRTEKSRIDSNGGSLIQSTSSLFKEESIHTPHGMLVRKRTLPLNPEIKNKRIHKDKPKDPIQEVFAKLKNENQVNKAIALPWSGQDTLELCDPYAAIWMTDFMSSIKLWKIGFWGTLKKCRRYARDIVTHDITTGILLARTFTTTVFLSLYRVGQPADELARIKIISDIITYSFWVEMTAKLFGQGIKQYVIEPLNWIDAAIVIISVVEIILAGFHVTSPIFRAIQAFSVLRGLRIARIVRLLRVMKTMQLLIRVISSTITSFVYIGMLLFIFLYIYALLGMQLFGGKFNFTEGKPRQNFDSFHNAFLSVYQVLTFENWQILQYNSMRAQISIFVALFYVSWLFIGNYVLLNLFLVLVLDAFAADEEIDDDIVFLIYQISQKKDQENETDSVASSIKIQRPGDSSSRPGSARGMALSTPAGISAYAIRANEQEENLNKKKKAKKPPLWDCDGVMSLYLFSKENRFRVLCWQIVTSDFFEVGILILIIMSSILLAIGTFYLNSTGSEAERIIDILNFALILFFNLEAVMKIVAYGLVLHSTAYLRDYWNILDFIVAVTSTFDVFILDSDIDMIRVLRLFRTFRPLRFLSHNNNMKIIVMALFKSFEAICNIIILIIIILLVFSIIGISLMAGRLQYCSINKYELSTKNACSKHGGQWRTHDLNFDNCLNGMIYLFQLTTEDNWPETVYNVVDSTGIGTGPKLNESWYYSYFHVIFIFVGSMFLLNLFVGVMSYNYTKVQRQQIGGNKNGGILTEDQLNWIEIQHMIVRAAPNFNVWSIPPVGSWRRVFHAIVVNFWFELFVALIILLNMVQMAMFYAGASDSYLYALEIVNYVYTGIFTLEAILKLIGFGMNYWYEAWNIFDFIVIVCSHIDIIFTIFTSNSLRLLRIGPQLIRVFRVFRVARLFRLAKKYQRLQSIMEIIQLCLPSILNVFALLTLILFIFAILGCYLFYDVTEGNAINSERNFWNFGMAMKLCLQIATGENWDKFMFDCARTTYDCAAGIGCGKWYAYAYFISFKIVVTYIMLNLFVLVVLQLFEKYFVDQGTPLANFKSDVDVFQESWLVAKPIHHGLFIHTSKIFRFFKSLPPRFCFEEDDMNLLAAQIDVLNIKSDDDRNICFNELLYCTLRPMYAGDIETNETIQKKERETRKRILKITSSKNTENNNDIVFF